MRDQGPDYVPPDALLDAPINDYVPAYSLSEDRFEAMRLMMQIEELHEQLPKIDCGSCGAPTCRALAEDIVRGKAKETDCIFKLRAKIQNVYDQLKNTI